MILPQNSDYTIMSNNEAASIICRFTPEMIQDIVEEALQNKFRSYSMTLANIVESIETNYKMAQAGILNIVQRLYLKDIILIDN